MLFALKILEIKLKRVIFLASALPLFHSTRTSREARATRGGCVLRETAWVYDELRWGTSLRQSLVSPILFTHSGRYVPFSSYLFLNSDIYEWGYFLKLNSSVITRKTGNRERLEETTSLGADFRASFEPKTISLNSSIKFLTYIGGNCFKHFKSYQANALRFTDQQNGATTCRKTFSANMNLPLIYTNRNSKTEFISTNLTNYQRSA